MPMKIITINIPQTYYDCIDMLVAAREFPSRSEAYRIILDEFLKTELPLLTQIDPICEKILQEAD